MSTTVTVIGAGLAGSEAAWQLAQRGIKVKLYEMRPVKNTPAHHTGNFAELVCSNSFRAAALENAVGLLKEEMRMMDSLIMKCADKHQLPAGGALAVDREGFSLEVTKTLANHPLVEVIKSEVTTIPEKDIVIVASGPLTSEKLGEQIKKVAGADYCYFFDAAAPIVTKESLDEQKVFAASRYDKGEAAYLNCPMTEEQYNRFWEALVNAEKAPVKHFEDGFYFEGCMPVEVLASRGPKTLLFGALKPVGLVDPATGRQPHAVVQLRQDNREGTLFNMVGFQTRLKWSEQERVFRMIPGMENAEFVRYGVMHRNTYINAPVVLEPTLQKKNNPHHFFAGQITGVEGYVESAAMGLVAGINASLLVQGQETIRWPNTTAHGALLNYITTADAQNFQPMNVTFGLFPPLELKVKGKRQRNKVHAERAIDDLTRFISDKLGEG